MKEWIESPSAEGLKIKMVMSKLAKLIAEKMTNLLSREFNLQLRIGVRLPMKTFRSLLSYLRFSKNELPLILDLLRKNEFCVIKSKNRIFLQKSIYFSSENNINQ
ncbi:MAG: hypothetical protein ABH874_00865 [Methanobacteriota archaeon]